MIKGKGNRLQRTVLVAAVAACFGAGLAYGNPAGPVVVNGQAAFASQGNVLSVTNTPGAIINWQQFSIGASEATRFIQQSAASAVLNRVVGINPSLILGTLQSNGRVFLINPNGILFGAGARIDVGGLIASSLNLADADFLAGKFAFKGDPLAGVVSNAGTIRSASGGQIILIAPQVENSGIIASPGGEIVLAAGSTVLLVDTADPALRVSITAPAGEAMNLGQIIVESGKIGIYAGLIRTSGTLSADSVAIGPGGEIYLKAAANVTLAGSSVASANGVQGGKVSIESGAGTTLASGRIEAKGETKAGGEIKLLGPQVGLLDAALDASGNSGGTILVGGDYQGKNPEVTNARASYVSADSSLHADATENGGGGKVVVWADEQTRFYGTISARGGPSGGNGGVVEVSGKQNLAFDGIVDTRAPNGLSGTLLLDPKNLIVKDIGGAAYNDGVNNLFGNDTGVTNTISATSLNGSSTNIVLQASNDLTVTDAINVTNAGTSLTMQAGRSIVISNAITTNNGAITLTANETVANGVVGSDRDAGSGDITIGGSGLNSGSGAIAVSGAVVSINSALVSVNAPISVTATNGGIDMPAGSLASGSGAITLTGTGFISSANYGIHLRNGVTVTTTSGNITFTAIGTGTAPGMRIANTGTKISTATGAITLTGTGGSAATVSAHGIHLDAGAIVESTGNSIITLAGTVTSGTFANFGIRLQAGQVKAVDGAINLTGIGNGTGIDNRGISVDSNSIVQATGNATVSLTGTGSLAGSASAGVRVTRGGIVSTKDGALTITGTGGGSGASNYGVNIDVSSGVQGLVRSTGTGTITIVGTGGGTTNDNVGVRVSGVASGVASKVTSVSGAVSLQGTGGGAGTGNYGIELNAGGVVQSTGGAALVLSGTGVAGAYGITGTGSLTTLAGGNATLNTTASALDLPASNISGNLDATASGAITQRGALTIAGTTTFAAGGTNDITLTDAANDFSSVAITSGRNVTLTDANSLVLRASTVLGTLDVGTAGALTQNGALIVTGATTFGAGNDITLTNAANDLSSVAITSGRDVTFTDANSLTLRASAVLGTVDLTAGGALLQTGALTATDITLVTVTGDLTLNGTISASGAGDSIVLAAGGNFVNNTGSAALDAGAGRWLVYSTNPAADTRGGLAYDFKQYNATYGVTPVLGTGNGFLYGLAPSVTASLIGTTSKVYDGTRDAALDAGHYTLNGAIDADAVNLSIATTLDSYDNKNAGTGKLVTATGLSIANATNGAATVYGYQLASAAASGNIGTITAAPLMITADDAARDQGQPNPAFAANYTGFVTGETPGVLTGTLSFSTPAVISSPPETYPITGFGQTSANYTITFTDGTLTVLPQGAASNPAPGLIDALLNAQDAALLTVLPQGAASNPAPGLIDALLNAQDAALRRLLCMISLSLDCPDKDRAATARLQ